MVFNLYLCNTYNLNIYTSHVLQLIKSKYTNNDCV